MNLGPAVPKDPTRPSSATSQVGRRSPGISGPYLTDPSGLKFLQLRSYQSSPKTSFSLQNHFLEEEETSFTVPVKVPEKVPVKVPAKPEPETKKENVKPEKEKRKSGRDSKPKPRSDSVCSGIEEIRLVQAAVNAFKRKKRYPLHVINYRSELSKVQDLRDNSTHP